MNCLKVKIVNGKIEVTPTDELPPIPKHLPPFFHPNYDKKVLEEVWECAMANAIVIGGKK